MAVLIALILPIAAVLTGIGLTIVATFAVRNWKRSAADIPDRRGR